MWAAIKIASIYAVVTVGLVAASDLILTSLMPANVATGAHVAIRESAGIIIGACLVYLVTRRAFHQSFAAQQTIESSQLEVVERLCKAAEFRDDATGKHVFRMSCYCSILGEKLGLPEKECDLLFLASQMHDIGKIGIPDRILLKPGPLNEEERRAMQDHVTVGARILGNSETPLLRSAQEIALSHHERWDGTGYPAGLAGRQIPLFARIASLCDVFDALTSERPYKRAWSFEDAVVEIGRQSGRQFDPLIVEAFMQSLDQFREIHHRYADKPSGHDRAAVGSGLRNGQSSQPLGGLVRSSIRLPRRRPNASERAVS
ncbi:MAG: HD domain-containing phosphohydrolase [Fimbriimonadaceae bacterium]